MLNDQTPKQSGLKPVHVKKYLKELFKFIDIVY